MRFMVTHPLKPGTTREDIEHLQAASQSDPDIRGYRSFMNLTQNCGFCVFEAPSEERLVEWFKQNGLEYDRIVPVELEGEYGHWIEVSAPAEVAAHR